MSENAMGSLSTKTLPILVQKETTINNEVPLVVDSMLENSWKSNAPEINKSLMSLQIAVAKRLRSPNLLEHLNPETEYDLTHLLKALPSSLKIKSICPLSLEMVRIHLQEAQLFLDRTGLGSHMSLLLLPLHDRLRAEDSPFKQELANLTLWLLYGTSMKVPGTTPS